MIDTHCHLEPFVTKGTLSTVLTQADFTSVKRMIAVGTDPEDWPVYQKLASEYPDKIYYSIGLHPCYVKENYVDAIEQIAHYVESSPRPVAIGEIGLDYFHLPQDQEQIKQTITHQKQSFRLQLELASKYNLPVIIHSRKAFKDCVDLIDASPVDWKQVVFHCFPDGPEEVKILNERGGRASFTGIITYKKSENIRQAALQQGLDLLMLETDAPYLSPEPCRGKPNEPAYLQHTAQFCAKLFKISLEELAEATTRNAVEFFSL